MRAFLKVYMLYYGCHYSIYTMAATILTLRRAYLQAFNGVFGDNYPESVEKMFIINAPLMFRGVWSFISPLMDKRTRDKTSILGGQKDYAPKLLEWVPADNLPNFLGGKDTSCDFIHEKGPWADSFPSGHMFAPGPPGGTVRRSVSGSLHQL